ncbi:MAG: 1-deoxy-D-xylulose-5-phosphate synthase [Bacteroidales bacterium]|nr:1-deoxy-D-xylulose-5-phosphate synthase [Bacteroidales bacterium]
MYRILDRVNFPEDIRALDASELTELCAEIRSYMVECCAGNPGHLASSLGAVELIVGLHYIYNTPEDKIVFDVGHQAYAHKILTGRKELFKLNRTREGISGFPKMDESPYDSFGVGHSSTSVSAALGLAEAAKLQGVNARTIAFIGDGALTGGLAFEGLNNAGDSAADLLIILNDNNQSIDRNIGALHEHLLRITTNPAYNRFKGKVWDRIGDRRIRTFLQRWIRSLKSWIVKGSGGDLFEALGFRYFGPIDGNDMEQVIETLRKLKGLKGPRILHCITTKGKGYAPAEADPTIWHAPGRFDPRTGERQRSAYTADRYQDVFGAVLLELAETDRRVVGITPAMATGCGMSDFAAKMPSRFFDVGIEEEHAVTFSAGLAAGGLRPFCNIYSSFAQRAYDQIIHDVALQNLPVTFCFDRAGVVGEDGPTHHGAFDLAAYRSIPGLTIAAPSDETELKNLMYTALHQDSPMIIRYPRGTGEGRDWREAGWAMLPPGKATRLVEGERIAVLALGPAAHRAVEAAEDFRKEYGFTPAVYDVRYLKPLDGEMLKEVASGFESVLTVEDGSLLGGLYGAVAEHLSAEGSGIRLAGSGIPDRFIPQDTQAAERAECGIDRNGILSQLRKLVEKD